MSVPKDCFTDSLRTGQRKVSAMPEKSIYTTNTAPNPAHQHDGDKAPIDISTAAATPATAREAKYFAVSPKGTHVEIPKELFIALSDFLETRKYPGAINIQFRSGEIICVEAIAKKRYR
jgi:hypothetical protein